MNRLIEVETSIPSFYFETRSEAQMRARREWTREWLRAIRRKITSEFDHDQKKMGDRIVRTQPRLVPAKT
jgi:hypothetical protein